MFHGKIGLLESCLNLCILHYLMFRRNRPLMGYEHFENGLDPRTLHPPNLIFHGRIGVTRVINTLEMGFTCAHTPLFYSSVAESYILSKVHFLFSIQLRFLDCWNIMRKDKSPSNWSFRMSRYKFQWKFNGTSLLEKNANICCCLSNGLTNKTHLNNEL